MFLETLGIEPRAAVSRSKCADHCAKLPPYNKNYVIMQAKKINMIYFHFGQLVSLKEQFNFHSETLNKFLLLAVSKYKVRKNTSSIL